MKKFIKNIDWSGIILCTLFAIMTVLFIVGSCVEAHADTIQGKTIIVEQKSKSQPVLTGYSIKVDGKVYQIYRGPKGGVYYIKDGKKVYLTKKQKALIK